MMNQSYDEQFQTVLLMLRPSVYAETYTIESDQLDNWLTQFEAWYGDVSATLKESWLYHKELTICGNDMFAYPEEFTKLLETTSKHRMTIFLDVDLYELYANFSLVEQLCKQGLIHVFYVNAVNADRIINDDEFVSFLEQLIQLGKQVLWINSYRYLQKRGVTSLEFFNRQNVSFYGMDEKNDYLGEITSYTSNPCRDGIKLVIGEDGYIYPCTKMIGMQEFAVSHITDEDPMKRLRENSIPCFNIAELLENGPRLTIVKQEDVKEEFDSMDVCELHRMELLSNEV